VPFFAGAEGGIYRSTDQGSSWWAVNTGLTYHYIASLLRFQSQVFAGAGNGIWSSSNEGASWSQLLLLGYTVRSLIQGPDSGNAQALFAATSSWYADEGGMLRSTDSGQTWVGAGLDAIDVYDLAVIPATPSASPASVLAATTGGLFLTADGGRSWVRLDSTIRFFGSLAVAQGADSTPIIYAGTWDDGIRISTDLGVTWHAMNDGLPVLGVSALAVIQADSQETSSILVASIASHGVYVYSRTNNAWNEFNTGLSNLLVPSLAASQSYLFAGTYGEGIFRRPLSEILTTVQIDKPDKPGVPRLFQNYPNPFNGQTTISFTLSSSMWAALHMYDLLGRHLVTLADAQLSPGTHSVQWHPINLASGIYFCRLTTQLGSQVRLVQLIK
jgi:hypothetical protein